MTQQVFVPAQWKGSIKTASSVRKEIAKRWGDEEAEKYNPLSNCFTYKTWLIKGYHVKKGEKAIESMTLVEVTDKVNDKEEKRSYLKNSLLVLYQTSRKAIGYLLRLFKQSKRV